MVTASIASDVRVLKADLSSTVVEEIKAYLTISNGDKERALKLKQWGANDLEDTVVLWSETDDELVLPRGFAPILRAGLEAKDIEMRWDDRTSAPMLPLYDLSQLDGPVLRDYQEIAAQELIRHRLGILVAPTAGGKTVVGLDAWRRCGMAGLILVEKASLLEQWQTRAWEHLKVETGVIGDGEWTEKPLTIAMLQTLYRRRYELDRDDFWRRWGFTLFDECHHAVADSYRQIITRCTSRVLGGQTATALEDEWEQPILTSMLGPIIHTVPPEELRKQGVRMAPVVKLVKTEFRWAPNAAQEKLVDSRAIYRHILRSFEKDSARINLIAETIAAQPEESAQLILCKSLAYLDAIIACTVFAGYPEDRIFNMRGITKLPRRREIAEIADNGHCAIFATVADEGTDIPRLDRLHLTWPQRKPRLLTQQIGRVLRRHPEKREVFIFDYADMQQPVFRSQAYERLQTYRKLGIPVDGI